MHRAGVTDFAEARALESRDTEQEQIRQARGEPPFPRKWMQEDQEFKVIPRHKVNPKPAWDTQDLVSGKNNKDQKKAGTLQVQCPEAQFPGPRFPD